MSLSLWLSLEAHNFLALAPSDWSGHTQPDVSSWFCKNSAWKYGLLTSPQPNFSSHHDSSFSGQRGKSVGEPAKRRSCLQMSLFAVSVHRNGLRRRLEAHLSCWEVKVKAAWGRILNIPLVVTDWIIVFSSTPLALHFLLVFSFRPLAALAGLAAAAVAFTSPALCYSSFLLQSFCLTRLRSSAVTHLKPSCRTAEVRGGPLLHTLWRKLLTGCIIQQHPSKKKGGECNRTASPCAPEPQHVRLYQRL